MGEPVKRFEWLSLVCILAVALVLRLIHLNSGLWYDEIVTLVVYVRLPTVDLLTTYSTLNNHILFSLAAKVSVTSFGESPWALRLPAVLFGVGSVAATWWLGRQVVSRGESLLAALFLACSSHHIWFSQNARGYTGLLLAALVATTLFVKGMRGTSRSIWIVYAVVLALAMYMHLSAAFLFATHALIFGFILAKQRLGRDRHVESPDAPGFGPLLGLGLGGVLTLLCYGPLLGQMVGTFTKASSGEPEGGVTEWKNPIWTLVETLESFGQGDPVILVGVAAGGILALVGAIHLCRQHLVFALIPLIHVPLALVALIVGSFRIWPRFFFVDAGFAILYLVHGTFVVARTATTLRRRGARPELHGHWAGVAATLVLVFGSLFLLPRTYQLPKQDFVGARDYIESARGPNDAVASVGLASKSYSTFYAPDWEIVENVQQLEQLRANEGNTWLVYSFPKHTINKYPEIIDVVERDFELVDTFWGSLNEGQVLVYRNR